MDRSYFDHISQELFKQKQRMDHLEAENRQLRQFLVDLRKGRGISVEISGTRFSLQDEESLPPSTQIRL